MTILAILIVVVVVFLIMTGRIECLMNLPVTPELDCLPVAPELDWHAQVVATLPDDIRGDFCPHAIDRLPSQYLEGGLVTPTHAELAAMVEPPVWNQGWTVT